MADVGLYYLHPENRNMAMQGPAKRGGRGPPEVVTCVQQQRIAGNRCPVSLGGSCLQMHRMKHMVGYTRLQSH